LAAAVRSKDLLSGEEKMGMNSDELYFKPTQVDQICAFDQGG